MSRDLLFKLISNLLLLLLADLLFQFFHCNQTLQCLEKTQKFSRQVVTEFNVQRHTSKGIGGSMLLFGDNFHTSYYLNSSPDLAIERYTLPNNYSTPKYIFDQEKIDLAVEITNKGTASADSILVVVAISDSESTIHYSDSLQIGNLSVGPKLILDFGENKSLKLEAGTYLIEYEVTSKTPENVVENNTVSKAFVVGSDSWIKNPGDSTAGVSNEDFSEIANVFYLPNNVSNVILDSVTFECYSESTLIGKSVSIHIIELEEGVSYSSGTVLANGSLMNFNSSNDLDYMIDMGWQIGQGSHIFSLEDNSNGVFRSKVTDFTDKAVYLKPGRCYLVILHYTGSNIIQRVSTNYPRHQVSTMVYIPQIGRWILIEAEGNPSYRSIANINLHLRRKRNGSSCDLAQVISSNGIYSSEGPVEGNTCFNCSNATSANWYTFEAPQDGVIVINSCYFGVDTRLFCYEGSCDNLNPLDSSDNSCDEFTSEGEGLASDITLNVLSGHKYFFEWDDRWSSSPFDFEFVFVGETNKCTNLLFDGREISSFRDEINCAESGDTIYLTPLLYGDTIHLSDEVLTVAKNLVFLGHPKLPISIMGGHNFDGLEIVDGITLVMENLKFIVNPIGEQCSIKNAGTLVLKNIQIQYRSTRIGCIFSTEGQVQMNPEVEIVSVP